MGFSIKANMPKDSNNEEFVPSETIGRIRYDWLNPETDEIVPIYLPVAIYFDNVKKNKVTGEGEFQERLLHGNDLLDAVREKLMELAPGESIDLTGFVFEGYRRKANQEVHHKKIDWKL